jgi:hypothetical protein
MSVPNVYFWVTAIFKVGLEEQFAMFLLAVGFNFKTNLFTSHKLANSFLDTNRFS